MIGRRMKCEYTVVKTLYLLVSILGLVKGEACYNAEFSEDVWPCPDFENTIMKCNPLELAIVDAKAGQLGLQGEIEICEEIDDETKMNVEVWKIIDIGKEYLYHAQGDICGNLKDDTTPWYPLIESMNISQCPIAAKFYEIKDMVLNLDHVKKMLTHELCGDYLVQMSMRKDLKETACYQLGIAISEYTCDN